MVNGSLSTRGVTWWNKLPNSTKHELEKFHGDTVWFQDYENRRHGIRVMFLTVDVPYAGLFNGRVRDACICQSLFTCDTMTEGVRAPSQLKRRACWNRHLLPLPCQGNRSCLWLRASRTAGSKQKQTVLYLSGQDLFCSSKPSALQTPNSIIF